MNKLLFTIAILLAYSGIFAQTWNVQTGAWISPLSKNIGIQKSLQVGDNVGTDSLWCNTDLNYFEGNVGIGTVTPTEKLDVNGNIICDTLFYGALDPAVGGSVWTLTGTTIAPTDTNNNVSITNLLSLTQPQTLTNANSLGNYMAAYNGKNASTYQIGFAYSTDGKQYYKDRTSNILTVGSGGTYDASGVYQPSMCRPWGDQIYLYYTGLNASSVESIGLFTSTNAGQSFTRYGQVLAVGTGWEATDIILPTIYFDTEDSSSRRFKMWYSGFDGTNYKIGYAYSGDGKTWTKYASNPVVTIGAGGQFDEAGVVTGAVIKQNGTFYLYYEGYNAGFAQSKIGVVSFTNPEGTYTKFAGNPIISNRNSATASLTANLTTGNTLVTVANTALFQLNEMVYVDDANSEPQINRVVRINSATTLTLEYAATADYTTAQSALIRSIYYSKISARSAVIENGTFKLYGSAYGSGLIIGATSIENTASFYGTSATAGWTIDYAQGTPIWNGTSAQFDYSSCENMSVINNPSPFLSKSAQNATWASESNVWTANQKIYYGGGGLSSWAANTSALQVGTDISIYSIASGNLQTLGFNTYWNGSAYKYSTTNPACNLGLLTLSSEAASFGISFAASGSADANATMTQKFGVTQSGNVFIGTNAASMTKGTNATGTLYFGTAVAPASSPADQFGLYGADANGAGTNAPHFRVETGDIIKLYRLSALTTGLTNITSSAAGTPDYAIQDLTNVGGYGFVTADEGQTTLSVIKNLQARVDELEARMKSLGILPP